MVKVITEPEITTNFGTIATAGMGLDNLKELKMLPKLYEFQSEFIQLMDEVENSINESGEIPQELSDKLDKFNENKILKVTNCVQYYFSLKSFFRCG
jgi:hypothetical protein